MEICHWLESIGLSHLKKAFEENGVDLDLLPGLTNDDLKDLGVTRLRDRKNILTEIAQLDLKNEELVDLSLIHI